jgi:radical SAM superfamily enzyme YgiQ (UPF0313 family)
VKILFIAPRYGRQRRLFPHAFAYLSAYLKKFMPDIKIDFVDMYLHGDDAIKEIYSKKTHDIVATTGLTSHYAGIKTVVSTMQQIKKGHTKIIVGGAIISSYPEFMIPHLGADYCFMGEGEAAFLEFVQRIAGGKNVDDVQNLGYCDSGGKVVINPTRPLIENIDEIPWQDYDTFDYKGFMKGVGYSGLVFGSRGCPFSCGFCYRLYGTKYRVRSIENLVEEMKFLVKKFGIFNFRFADELFFLKKERIEEFCRKLLAEKLNVSWYCSLRVNIVSPDILKLMHRCGCMSIGYGIESGSPAMLEKMNKKASVEQNIKALKMTIDAGIFPAVNAIIGYPGETKDTIRQTEEMLAEAQVHPGLHFIQALPGTDVYNEVRSRGFIADEERYFMSLYDHIDGLPMDFTGMGKDFIEAEQHRIIERFKPNYVKLYKKYQMEEIKYYLRTINTNFLKYAAVKLLRKPFKKLCGE